MATVETDRAIEACFRAERARLVAGLTRMVRNMDRAEELAQDALVAALTDWPSRGIPDRPGAWLMTVARRRAVDGLRKEQMRERKLAELVHEQTLAQKHDDSSIDAALDDGLDDELLGLLFAACHPILPADSRAALTLRVVGGLTTTEIARAFLSSESTVAQRIVRAKRAIHQAGLTFDVPRGEALTERLPSVLEVIYLIFNEGYAATAGDDLVRPALAHEAIRLGNVLAGLLPDEPEVYALHALMLLQASRMEARTGPDGAFVPITEQDRSRWDWPLVERGLSALAQALRQATGRSHGPYLLQAALAACHARATTAEDTDWPRIAALYDRLVAIMPSPVVSLNRAIAHGMAFGPEAGLMLVDEISDPPALSGYAPLPAARGDLLFRADRLDDARREFEAAAALAENMRERDHLLRRAGDCLD